MTSTIIKDSIVGDAWIRECCQLNPISRVIDPKTGMPNGNILSGPVRLAFTETLFEPRAASNNPTGAKKYGVTALYTPVSDLTIMYEEYYKVLGGTFAEMYNPGTGQYYGLQSPFRDQAEKSMKYAGFTPGCTFMAHTSKFLPQIVDARGNPITDRGRVYAGVWAVLAVNPYPYGKSPPQPKKGCAFGLQQVMLIGEDSKLAGGAPDPRTTFAAVNVKPPVVAPNAAFGGAPPMAPPPGAMGGMYPAYAATPPPLGGHPPAYAPTAPGYPAPLAPPPFAAPADDDISAYY